jgi:hypothetical protein
MLLDFLITVLEIFAFSVSESTSPKNKDLTKTEQQLNEKPEKIVFNVSRSNLIRNFLLGYGIYIAIACSHKLSAFF